MTDLSSLNVSAPRAQMNARIAAAASAGTIGSADRTAPYTAPDSIDTPLSSGTGQPGGSVKDRIDGLVGQQVSNGTLTGDQASELRSFFAQGGQAPAGGGVESSASGVQGASVADVAHHARGGHGRHEAVSTFDDASTSAATTGSTPVSTSFSSALDDELKQVNRLLDKVRQSLSSSVTYGATASGAGAGSGLILNTAA